MTDAKKARAIAALASASGELESAHRRVTELTTKRDGLAVRAQQNGATYEEMGTATQLSRMGVTKMLKRGKSQL